MDLEAPEHAVGIWIEGDRFAIRFPDRQLIHIPISEVGRLTNLLKVRADYAERKLRMGIGTPAAPVQYDIDVIAEAVTRERFDEQRGSYREKVEAAKADRYAKERERRLRRAERAQKAKEADELLTIAGLI